MSKCHNFYYCNWTVSSISKSLCLEWRKAIGFCICNMLTDILKSNHALVINLFSVLTQEDERQVSPAGEPLSKANRVLSVPLSAVTFRLMSLSLDGTKRLLQLQASRMGSKQKEGRSRDWQVAYQES